MTPTVRFAMASTTRQTDSTNWLRWALAIAAFLVASWASFADAAENEEVAFLLEEAILDAAPWTDARVEVSGIRVVGKMPKGQLSVRLRDRRRIHGNVRAELIGDDRRSWLTADVEIFVPVVVATAEHRRGDRLTAYTTEERPVSRLPRNFLWDLNAVEGVVARRTIRAGDVIDERDVEAPLAIERNQMVIVLVRRGAVVVSTRGVALSNGRVGDVVRIRNMASKAVTDAVAVRAGTVVVP
jgi:flagella basal body P-ring formation protein FlgA